MAGNDRHDVGGGDTEMSVGGNERNECHLIKKCKTCVTTGEGLGRDPWLHALVSRVYRC